MTAPRVDRIPQLRDLERQRCDQANARVLGQACIAAEQPPPPHRRPIPSPAELRGIPCTAPGVGGVMPGTKPGARYEQP